MILGLSLEQRSRAPVVLTTFRALGHPLLTHLEGLLHLAEVGVDHGLRHPLPLQLPVLLDLAVRLPGQVAALGGGAVVEEVRLGVAVHLLHGGHEQVALVHDLGRPGRGPGQRQRPQRFRVLLCGLDPDQGLE